MAGMEKRKAHYSLEKVKAEVLKHGMDAFTRTAVRGMDAMGLDETEGQSVILGLQADMLQKSMTSHADSSIWQDVYHAPCPNGKTAYVKLTLRPRDTVVIQFKEK